MDSGVGRCWGCGGGGRLWCSQCRLALYCSITCQKKDAPRHLDECAASSRRTVTCNYCGREEALGGVPCPGCLVVAYCSDSCREMDAKNHRGVCLHAKTMVVEAAKKISGWSRRAKGIPQYIGRLIHAVDYIRWSENEGARIQASQQEQLMTSSKLSQANERKGDHTHGDVDDERKKEEDEGGGGGRGGKQGEDEEGKMDEEALRLLLLGADLKHVLSTLHNTPDHCTQVIEMTLVDSSPHILARDLLMLYLLLLSLDDPVPRADHAHAHKVVMIFYSVSLDMETHALLCNTLHNLLNLSHAAFLSETRRQVLVDAVTYRLAQAVWSGWMSFANDPAALQKLEKVRTLKQSGRAVKEVLVRYIKSCPKQHQRAVSDWVKRGSLNRTHNGNFPNVTLACFSPLRSENLDKFEDVAPKWSEETEWLRGVEVEDDMVYAPHGMDIIFQDWDYNTVVHSVRQDVSLVDMYRIFLTQVFARARHQLLRSSRFSLLFIRAQIQDLATHPTILKGKFDRIATGIQADLLGTPYVLQHLGKLLREDNIFARLITHHRVWSLCLDWRKDQQAREACQKSKKTQRVPDPLLLLTGRWATFRHFLQAELLYHLHQQDNRPLHPENAPVFRNVRRAYQMLLSDYTRHLNNIVPFRFQADKRTASMVDSRLHSLEWRQLTQSRLSSTPTVIPASPPSSPLHDIDPASHYVDNLISFSHQSQSIPASEQISPKSKVETSAMVAYSPQSINKSHLSKQHQSSDKYDRSTNEVTQQQTNTVSLSSKSTSQQSDSDGKNVINSRKQSVQQSTPSSTKSISNQQASRESQPISSGKDPLTQQPNNNSQSSKEADSYQCSNDNETIQPFDQQEQDQPSSSISPSTATTKATITTTSSISQHRPRSLYVSSHPKSPLLSPEFDFWERQDILKEKQKKPTIRTYAEIPVGISRRIQQVFQSESKKDKVAPKSAPVSPELSRKKHVVKEKASVFERGVPERSTYPETRKNLDMIPTTPVRKLISMFSRAFALKDKDKDMMIRGRYRRSHSLHGSLYPMTDMKDDGNDGNQEKSFTNSLRISRCKNKSHKYREIDESGLCTFPRRARPHSVAVSKFYVDISDDEDKKATNSLQRSPNPSMTSLAVDTTNDPRKRRDHESPIRSLISSVNLGSPSRKRNVSKSPLRDTITVKRDELRLVNLRPGSPRLPSPVSPSPAADYLPTMDWPEHTSASPCTQLRSSVLLPHGSSSDIHHSRSDSIDKPRTDHLTADSPPQSHSRPHSPRPQHKEDSLSQKSSSVDTPAYHHHHQQQQHPQVDHSQSVRSLVFPSFPIKPGIKRLIKVIPSEPQYEPPPLARSPTVTVQTATPAGSETEKAVFEDEAKLVQKSFDAEIQRREDLHCIFSPRPSPELSPRKLSPRGGGKGASEGTTTKVNTHPGHSSRTQPSSKKRIIVREGKLSPKTGTVQIHRAMDEAEVKQTENNKLGETTGRENDSHTSCPTPVMSSLSPASSFPSLVVTSPKTDKFASTASLCTSDTLTSTSTPVSSTSPQTDRIICDVIISVAASTTATFTSSTSPPATSTSVATSSIPQATSDSVAIPSTSPVTSTFVATSSCTQPVTSTPALVTSLTPPTPTLIVTLPPPITTAAAAATTLISQPKSLTSTDTCDSSSSESPSLTTTPTISDSTAKPASLTTTTTTSDSPAKPASFMSTAATCDHSLKPDSTTHRAGEVITVSNTSSAAAASLATRPAVTSTTSVPILSSTSVNFVLPVSSQMSFSAPTPVESQVPTPSVSTHTPTPLSPTVSSPESSSSVIKAPASFLVPPSRPDSLEPSSASNVSASTLPSLIPFSFSSSFTPTLLLTPSTPGPLLSPRTPASPLKPKTSSFVFPSPPPNPPSYIMSPSTPPSLKSPSITSSLISPSTPGSLTSAPTPLSLISPSTFDSSSSTPSSIPASSSISSPSTPAAPILLLTNPLASTNGSLTSPPSPDSNRSEQYFPPHASLSMSSSLTDADMEVSALLAHEEKFCPIQEFIDVDKGREDGSRRRPIALVEGESSDTLRKHSPDLDTQTTTSTTKTEKQQRKSVGKYGCSEANMTDTKAHGDTGSPPAITDPLDTVENQDDEEESLTIYKSAPGPTSSMPASDTKTKSVCKIVEHFAQRIQEQTDSLQTPQTSTSRRDSRKTRPSPSSTSWSPGDTVETRCNDHQEPLKTFESKSLSSTDCAGRYEKQKRETQVTPDDTEGEKVASVPIKPLNCTLRGTPVSSFEGREDQSPYNSSTKIHGKRSKCKSDRSEEGTVGSASSGRGECCFGDQQQKFTPIAASTTTTLCHSPTPVNKMVEEFSLRIKAQSLPTSPRSSRPNSIGTLIQQDFMRLYSASPTPQDSNEPSPRHREEDCGLSSSVQSFGEYQEAIFNLSDVDDNEAGGIIKIRGNRIDIPVTLISPAEEETEDMKVGVGQQQEVSKEGERDVSEECEGVSQVNVTKDKVTQLKARGTEKEEQEIKSEVPVKAASKERDTNKTTNSQKDPRELVKTYRDNTRHSEQDDWSSKGNRSEMGGETSLAAKGEMREVRKDGGNACMGRTSNQGLRQQFLQMVQGMNRDSTELDVKRDDDKILNDECISDTGCSTDQQQHTSEISKENVKKPGVNEESEITSNNCDLGVMQYIVQVDTVGEGEGALSLLAAREGEGAHEDSEELCFIRYTPGSQASTSLSPASPNCAKFSSQTLTSPSFTSPRGSRGPSPLRHLGHSNTVPRLRSSRTGGIDKISFRRLVKGGVGQEEEEEQKEEGGVPEHVVEFTSSFEVSIDDLQDDVGSVEEAVEAFSFLEDDMAYPRSSGDSDDEGHQEGSLGFKREKYRMQVAPQDSGGDAGVLVPPEVSRRLAEYAAKRRLSDCKSPSPTPPDAPVFQRRFLWGSLTRKRKNAQIALDSCPPFQSQHTSQPKLDIQSKNKNTRDAGAPAKEKETVGAGMYKNPEGTKPTVLSVVPKATDMVTYARLSPTTMPIPRRRISPSRDISSDNFSQSLIKLIGPRSESPPPLPRERLSPPSTNTKTSDQSEGTNTKPDEVEKPHEGEKTEENTGMLFPTPTTTAQETESGTTHIQDEEEVFETGVSQGGAVEVRRRAGVLKTSRDRSRESRRSLRVSWGDLPDRQDFLSSTSPQPIPSSSPYKVEDKGYRVTQL